MSQDTCAHCDHPILQRIHGPWCPRCRMWLVLDPHRRWQHWKWRQ